MGRCCKVVGEECQIRNLGLGYHDPSAFTDSPALPRPAFAVYRLVIAALFVADLIYTALTHPEGFWVIHMVNWSRLFCILHFLLGGLASLFESIRARKSSVKYSYSFLQGNKESYLINNLSWHNEVHWVIYTIAADSAFVVTAAYFSFFFRLHFSIPGLFDIPRHTVYTLLMLFDTLASHMPVRFFHFIYAYIFGAAYVVFSLATILMDGNGLEREPLVFPSLDFSDEPLLTTAWLSIFLLVGLPLAHAVYFLFYKMRSVIISG